MSHGKLYTGRRVCRDRQINPDAEVWVTLDDGRQYVLPHIIQHSPTGMEWGYGGSGPADLALSLLVDFGLRQEVALSFYQDFKWAKIARLPATEWTLSRREIGDWLAARLIWFSDSPDAGPACICSLCGLPIEDDESTNATPPLRMWSQDGKQEARFHQSCGLPLLEGAI